MSTRHRQRCQCDARQADGHGLVRRAGSSGRCCSRAVCRALLPLHTVHVRAGLSCPASAAHTPLLVLQPVRRMHVNVNVNVNVDNLHVILVCCCSLRLLLFCTCPPLCAGALWPMPAWVWRDARFFYNFFFGLSVWRPVFDASWFKAWHTVNQHSTDRGAGCLCMHGF